MLENSFFSLSHLPLIDAAHIELCKQAEYVPPPPETIKRSHRDWTSNAHLFNSSKFCNDLKTAFGKCHGHYVRTNPMTVYDWHCDYGRKACINVLLVQPQGALTLHRSMVNRLIYNIRICEYELLRPTLFNTTIPHSVINPTDQYRYILTISFGEIPTIWDLKEWLSNYNSGL